jgi:alkylhydroperoxidase/carboxymuconolactone decarboxylase family protein YurZ
MSTPTSERKKQLRDEFIDARGYWNEFWDSLLELDEEFFQAYTQFSSVPWKHGPLDPKVKEFVYIAVDAAATHLYVPGIQQHIRQALEHGASAAEIMEVLELTATLGIHACNIGVPILVEELEAVGQPVSKELSERQEEIKAEFTEKRGYWNPFWDEMLWLDPEFFAAYTQFSSVPWVSGTLEPKVKELIYTAFDVSATHLYVSGLRQHIRNALAYGASREEVLEVIELASVIGIHSCTVGVPILVEELAGGAAES